MSSAPKPVPPSINSWSPEYLDEQYARFREDPGSLPAGLRAFFEGFEMGRSPGAAPGAGQGHTGEASRFQSAIESLIHAYRTQGHLAARLDPFDRERDRPECLELAFHGLSETDLQREVEAERVGLEGRVTLGSLIKHLEDRYCGTIGVEVMHVAEAEERDWLLDRFERGVDRSPMSRGERVHLLEQLLHAEQFERFIQKRYPGEKRFSLEGSESLIPLLDRLLEHSARLGVEEFVIGMAHRGRLNVLNNILGKTYEQIFTEFEDSWEEDFADGGGDVKYHRGYSGERNYADGRKLHLAMASNPSHLEAVDPVVLGRTRAKQRLRGDAASRTRVASLLIHGDAALPGQGVAAETLNLSQLDGYTVGGTVHVVVNNLIGFTTGPEDARSMQYCTDVARAIKTPVLHVNGEDPEAVIACAHFAAEYRVKFQKDVFIDLWCYRRYGHNEQDEASFTQPKLHELFRQRRSVLDAYAERLRDENVITDDDLGQIRTRLNEALDHAQTLAKQKPSDPTIDPGSQRWDGLGHRFAFEDADTSVSIDAVREVASALGRVPDSFKLHRKLKKLLSDRAGLPDAEAISYADAESLAIGTLLIEGYPVRLTGQDSGRGTFSHRHAVLRDQETGERYVPLNHIRPTVIDPDLRRQGAHPEDRTQARFCIHDSPLSEMAVVGFEYGYSLADPDMLVMWEAQFGDFCNGAQTIIDQFIASAESKWQRWSGLVLLLPHGYEGAGPEHSSARLERFLQLFGDNNIQVAYPSTAGQAFHMFRRQLKRSFRKPLVVMTPKSMLRTPTGKIQDLLAGRFYEILDDPRMGTDSSNRSGVKRVVLCTGKIYHELDNRRTELGREDVAIVRVEQIAPLHTEGLGKILASYPDSAEKVWVQEEPRNMGAYLYVADRLRTRLSLDALRYIGRPESATPASGSKSKDRQQQESILADAIGALPASKAKGGEPSDATTSFSAA